MHFFMTKFTKEAKLMAVKRHWGSEHPFKRVGDPIGADGEGDALRLNVFNIKRQKYWKGPIQTIQ